MADSQATGGIQDRSGGRSRAVLAAQCPPEKGRVKVRESSVAAVQDRCRGVLRQLQQALIADASTCGRNRIVLK